MARLQAFRERKKLFLIRMLISQSIFNPPVKRFYCFNKALQQLIQVLMEKRFIATIIQNLKQQVSTLNF